MTAAELRQTFLHYFRDRDHEVVPASSLVPAEDPTLLFTNAGMNQFKDVFLGRDVRSYRRAVSAQKCVRAGGKHNDLDAVGRDGRHLTFFEMLGNWSFGDYFKAGAIEYAWDFVTRVLGLPQERLWVTVYQDDDEAHQLWQDVAGLPPSRIVRLGEHDNFWEMGDTGPCGPDTEIFIDRGEAFACGPRCGIGQCECDRFVEVWNLVFIQFDRAADGTLIPLAMPCVDTGMGLERVAAVLEGLQTGFVPDVWDTDLLRPLIRVVEGLSGQTYDRGANGMPFRVIADHARTVTMLLADGIAFSNEGRGYVMRRILRRAVRYGRVLGLHEAFLWKLVPTVGEVLGSAYPEVTRGQASIMATIQGEEERFQLTLQSGLQLLDSLLAAVPPGGELGGDSAFLLYDTYGFPLDLTEDVAAEHGVRVDRPGFDANMAAQRQRARRVASSVSGLPAMPASHFVGYSQLEADAQLELMLRHGEPVERAELGDEVTVYMGLTPFYPQGGGQVGDQGTLRGPHGTLRVEDTEKEGGAIWHRARVTEGIVEQGDAVHAAVDSARRQGAMRNHTGTHLLHAALREVLGDGARQTGSLVAPDRLRFDFSHPAPMTPAEVRTVEDLVNRWILDDRPVATVETSLQQARESGAIAFFGEKYGEMVRVVEVPGASKELCGGTHCKRTGQIGSLRIIEESGIGSGMRRVEALTGWGALAWSRDNEQALHDAAAALKTSVADVVTRAEELAKRVRELERVVAEQAERDAAARGASLLNQRERIAGLNVLLTEVDATGLDTLRQLGDAVRGQVDAAVLAARDAERGWVLVMAGAEALRRGIQAGALVRELAPLIGGGGGGRADLAQAGGKTPEGVADALRLARRLLEERGRQDIPEKGAN